MTINFTAHGLHLQVWKDIAPESTKSWVWFHYDGGKIQHSSSELHGIENGYFDTPEEAKADAEAYALQVCREMEEAHSRPIEESTRKAITDFASALTSLYEPKQRQWEISKDRHNFDFTIEQDDDGYYWSEWNHSDQSEGYFATRYEAQADILRYVSEWLSPEEREEQERRESAEYWRYRDGVAFDHANAIGA